MSRDPRLPGTTSAVVATRIVVVAPHPDDEVLGCGGLLARLARAGARIGLLALSDGGGGQEVPDAGPEYRQRRRREAENAARRLGLAASERLDLPDGALEHHLDEIVAALRGALVAHRPEILLLPSPLEVSADHRAAFAAAHRLLSPLRRGDPLLADLEGMRVLLYEVNRPLLPDLLVDVSDEIPALEEAMACYGSQEERHPYLAAAIGLRRFRTLTLGPEVRAAEGYAELSLADFRTRGLTLLVAELGGATEPLLVREGPSVSVVVRTRDRPELLAEALASLAASRHRPLEVVLVNDGGRPPEVDLGFPLPVRRIELQPGCGRAAAANAGIAAATGEYIGFLDDDDLVEPEHFSVLAGMVEGAGVEVAYTDAAVGIWELGEGRGWRRVERRLPYSREFDPELLLLDNYIPFHTLLVARDLLRAVGPLAEELPFFEDWDLLVRLSRRARFHHRPLVTCEYRHFRSGGQVFGESPRGRADFLDRKAEVLARHRDLLTPEVLARVSARLRDEAVAAIEEADDHRRRRLALEQSAQRLHGEVVTLRGDLVRFSRVAEERAEELERLWREEKGLRDAVAGQHEHLARAYAEIERLTALVREMEGTRAWRLHRWLARRGS